MTDPTRPPGTIVVSGTGRVAVDPDVADLRLGVAISRPTVEAARAAAADAMAAILAAVSGRRASPVGTCARPSCRSSRATTTATARRRR